MASSIRPVVCIVTPGTRSANNGNWRTASRWQAMLRDRYRVILQSRWDGKPVDAMIALHAKRSADSIAAYRATTQAQSLAVALSGTDLYRDLPDSQEAARSLDAADHIVALQDQALELLEERWSAKARVIYQSARPLAHRRKTQSVLTCVAVGHLRSEKDPATLFAAVGQLPRDLPIRIRHLGAPLDEALGRSARALSRADSRYQYSGAVPHGLARVAIASADLLLHPSRMEGGANVIAEAVVSGTAVIASRVPGNVGMLGVDYPGYFEPGDASGLAACLVRAWEDAAFLRSLRSACARRRSLFLPASETRSIRQLAAILAA